METRISRRDFLSITGICAAGLFSASVLGGCSTQSVPATSDNADTNASSSEETTQPASASVAVICFSATGNTMAQAETIAERLGVAVDEIVPEEPYSSADLDYNEDNTRANLEAQNPSARPAIGSARTDLSGVDTIYLGYPIWWGDAAPIIRTYVESVDLTGKKVVPFCTSGSSGISASVATLESLANGGEWTAGLRLAGSDSQIDELLAQ